MLGDLFPIRHHWFDRSRFHQDLEDFSAWLQAARYTPGLIYEHLLRLKRTLERMHLSTPGGTYTVSQLEAGFEKADFSVSTKQNYRGTQHAFQRFLLSNGRLKVAACKVRFEPLQSRYCQWLREMRGLSRSTLQQHSATVADFLARGIASNRPLSAITHADVERYIALKSRENTRQSLQSIVGQLRAFLRYGHERGEIRLRLDAIDAPRTYRGELPPRALEWNVIQSLLRSIDRRSKAGWRDYTILHLMAHYGLRPSEIVSLRLDSIDWLARTLRVEQRKTRSTLILPLARQTVLILRRYLYHDRGHEKDEYRELFLRMCCPRVALKYSAITQIFQKRVLQSRLEIKNHSVYCLRHGFAMRLLKRGVGVKAIGDVMGHRSLASTCAYLRLDTTMLRDVALPVPRSHRRARRNRG
jgi:integrase/recombinase XerD